MLLRKDFYKEIKVCPTCKGFGVLNPEDPSYDFDYCDDCEGFGVFSDEEKGRVVFGLPLFIDFGTRKKLNMFRLIGILVVLLIIIISAVIIF